MTRPPVTVDLIRHAESQMNVAMADPDAIPFIGGRENHIDLSPRGEDQSRALGRFAIDNGIRPTQLHHSPAVRSRRTCKISADVMGLGLTMNPDDRLQELDQGAWTGLPRTTYDDPINAAAMLRAGSNFAPPSGQSMNDVADQIDSFLSSLCDTGGAEGAEHVWVHTHGVAIKAWLGRLCGWSHERTYKTRIDNVSLSRVIMHNGVWVPQFINEGPATV